MQYLPNTANLCRQMNISFAHQMFNDENLETIKFGMSSIAPGSKIFQKRIVKYAENGTYRIQDSQINTIVVHTTSLNSVEEAVMVYHQYGVSAHLIIDQEGTVFLLVPLEMQAFHAGASYFGSLNKLGVKDYGIQYIKSLNPTSIGIEFLTPDFHTITQAQVNSYVMLVENIKFVYPGIRNIVQHSTIAPDRKEDPSVLAYMAISKQQFKGIASLPTRCNDHAVLLDIFSAPERYAIQDIYSAAELLREVGYNTILLDEETRMHDLVINCVNALCDYIKSTAPNSYLANEYLLYYIRKLKISKIYSYIQRLLDQNVIKDSFVFNKLPQNLQDVANILRLVNNPIASNMFKQMELGDGMEYILKLQSQKLIQSQMIEYFLEQIS